MTDSSSSFPTSSLVDLNIPKEKFYQASGASQKIKRLFIDEVDRILLKAVIAPRTMNISGETGMEELHIIEVWLKRSEITLKILETIDSVIPKPIVFTIIRNKEQRMYVSSYKELNGTNSPKSKVIHYYKTDWGAPPLRIVGSSVKGIYANFLRQIDESFDATKPINEAVAYTQAKALITNQIEHLNKRIRLEPSIAKKQELARQRHMLEQNLNSDI